MKTTKFFECFFGGQRVIIIYHEGKENPFRIYRKYWDGGWKKELLGKCADFKSCLEYVTAYYRQMTNIYSDSIYVD